jgi:hypothetical protein
MAAVVPFWALVWLLESLEPKASFEFVEVLEGLAPSEDEEPLPSRVEP